MASDENPNASGWLAEKVRQGAEWLARKAQSGAELPKRAMDAARSASSGAPGDEGTTLFGKKGPREFGKGDVRRDAERAEEARAAAQSVDDMTPLRARIFAAFLNPAPGAKKDRELLGRAASLATITRAVLYSEGVAPDSLSETVAVMKRAEVKAEAERMRDAKLLGNVSPPSDAPDGVWFADPGTYTLTDDGAVQAYAVYAAAVRGGAA